MFKAEILADSLSPSGDRLTTMKVTFPRIVLAEFNTHRVFSRNSASSRAIPFSKMVKMVRENPFVPLAFQMSHKGMQGAEYPSVGDQKKIKMKWLQARDAIVLHAINVAAGVLNPTTIFEYDERGRLIPVKGKEEVTKQMVNRLLEPFMWHTVIVTATEWENFFKLRCPQYAYKFTSEDIGYFKSKREWARQWYEDTRDSCSTENNVLSWLEINKSEAEIHIAAIAERMYDVLKESTPKQLQPGEWHIPFGDNMDEREIDRIVSLAHERNATEQELESLKLKIAVARCARISYQTLGDNPKINYEADLKLYNILYSNGHASPFEHIAQCMDLEEYMTYWRGKVDVEYVLPQSGGVPDKVDWEDTHPNQGWCRNFRGFKQFRDIENI